MAIRDRIYGVTDAPMTWTRAILLGIGIWVFSIVALGQIPSVIIYKFDEYIATLIEWSKKIPGVAEAGLNPTQIALIRDLVANGAQMTALVVMLVGAYVWQERKRKRVGGKGVQDVVKGYMPGK